MPLLSSNQLFTTKGTKARKPTRSSNMPLFLIHYDLLQKPDVEYPTLVPTLTRLGATRLTSTAWAVRAEMSVAEL